MKNGGPQQAWSRSLQRTMGMTTHQEPAFRARLGVFGIRDTYVKNERDTGYLAKKVMEYGRFRTDIPGY